MKAMLLSGVSDLAQTDKPLVMTEIPQPSPGEAIRLSAG
jgi:hypothetical protein